MKNKNDSLNMEKVEEFIRELEKKGLPKKAEEDGTREFQEELDSMKDVIIGVMGKVSAGKSTLINSLFNAEIAEVSAIPGTTQDIQVYRFDDKTVIVDTPGLQDIESSRSDKAREYVENMDVGIYIFSDASVGKEELENFHMLCDRVPYVIPVFNKLDTVPEEERGKLVEWLEAKIGRRVIPASLKPAVPGMEPFGLEEIEAELEKALSDRMVLLGPHLRELKFKDRVVEKRLWAYAATAATIGFLPLPGSDIVPLTKLQVAMGLHIARIYGYKDTAKDIVRLLGSIATGLAGREIFRQLVKLIPGAGQVLGALIAGSFTYALGKAFKAYYRSGKQKEISELIETAKEAVEEYRRKAKEH